MKFNELLTEAKITSIDGETFRSPKEAYKALLLQGKTPEEIMATFPDIKLPAHKYFLRIAKRELGPELAKSEKRREKAIERSLKPKVKAKKLKLSAAVFNLFKDLELDATDFKLGRTDEEEWGTEHGFERLSFVKALSNATKLKDGYSISIDGDAENFLLSPAGAVANGISILRSTDGDAEAIKQLERIQNGNFSKNFRVFSDETVEKRKQTAVTNAWEKKDYSLSKGDTEFFAKHNLAELRRFKRTDKEDLKNIGKFTKFFVMPDGALAVLTDNKIPKDPKPESNDPRLISYFTKSVEGGQIISLIKLLMSKSSTKIKLDDLLKKKIGKIVKGL